MSLLRPTIQDPIEGMIENTGRYTKKIGGKRYLIYIETIARQVKLDNGKSVQEVADNVDEYFRLSKAYVAERAEAAKQSEDNAKASEVAAKASENAAAVSASAAAASQRAAAASEQHCEEIAADVDAAIERAAYEQITERVVPTCINEARDQAVEILVPEITDNLAEGLNQRADAKFAEQDERLDEFKESLDAEFFATTRSITKINNTLIKQSDRITKVDRKLDTKVSELNDRIDAEVNELNERLEADQLSTARAIAEIASTDMEQSERITKNYMRQQADKADTDAQITAVGERIDSEVATLNERIETEQLNTTRVIAKISATDIQQSNRITEMTTRFNDKQIADVERFSNLSYASVLHTRYLQELEEFKLNEAFSNCVAACKQALVNILQSDRITKMYAKLKTAINSGTGSDVSGSTVISDMGEVTNSIVDDDETDAVYVDMGELQEG